MRNRDFHIDLTVLSADELIGFGGRIILDKIVQRNRCVIARFHFDGNDLSVFLNLKLDFMHAVWLVIVKGVAKLDHALGNCVFINTAACVALDGVMHKSRYSVNILFHKNGY